MTSSRPQGKIEKNQEKTWLKLGYDVLQCETCGKRIPNMQGMMMSHVESHDWMGKNVWNHIFSYFKVVKEPKKK